MLNNFLKITFSGLTILRAASSSKRPNNPLRIISHQVRHTPDFSNSLDQLRDSADFIILHTIQLIDQDNDGAPSPRNLLFKCFPLLVGSGGCPARC